MRDPRLQIDRRQILRPWERRGEIIIIRGTLRLGWRIVVTGITENPVNEGDDNDHVAHEHEYRHLDNFNHQYTKEEKERTEPASKQESVALDLWD